MAEFTAITTQEQLDAVIGERLKREREGAAKKYGDYDNLKSKVAAYEKQIGEMTRAAEEQAQRYADYDQRLAGLQAQVKDQETAAIKTRVALESGIPYELVGRLAGETEEDIRRDAEALAKFVGKGSTPPPPLRSTEPAGTDTKQAALRALTTQLANKGD